MDNVKYFTPAQVAQVGGNVRWVDLKDISVTYLKRDFHA
jgi:hypothetical protein